MEEGIHLQNNGVCVGVAPILHPVHNHSRLERGQHGMRTWVVRLEDLFAKSIEEQKSLCHAVQVRFESVFVGP